MRNLLVWLGFTLISMTANAAEYKCYASKYPSGVQHSFENGYVLLKINKKSVNFKYFYVNTVAHETTIELDVNYKLQGVVGGNGQVKDMISGSLVSGDTPFPGDEIETMFFDPALISNENANKKGIIGKFTFTGHGYSYDWNICYNSK